MKNKIRQIFLSLIIFIVLISCSTKRMDNVILHPILKKLAPIEQYYEINPFLKNEVIGVKGTKLIIPERAFDLDYEDLNKNETITIKLIEVIDVFDFVTSGIDLIYINDEGNEEIFESAGMFKISAEHKNDIIKLQKDLKIEINFPNIVSGEKFNMYKLAQNGQWKYNGHNQECSFDEDTLKTKEAYEKIYQLQVGVRKYLIDELTWWNIDYPDSNSSCISGKIDNDKDKYSQAIVIGISKKVYNSLWFKGNEFKINSFLMTDVKILIITEDGRIGVSNTFNTGERYGTSNSAEGPNNYYYKLSAIELKKVDPDILNNREKLLNYIGIEDVKYKVKY